MLTIRLQRVGSKNDPAFRIVLAEKHRAVKRQAVEILGHYNPRTKEFGLKDEERLKYWIGQNVEVSPTVHNLFVGKGLIESGKVQAWRPKVKKQAEETAEAKAAPTPAEGGDGAPTEPSESSESVGEESAEAKEEAPAEEAKQDDVKKEDNVHPPKTSDEVSAGKEEKQPEPEETKPDDKPAEEAKE